jgi:hypothetical protein
MILFKKKIEGRNYQIYSLPYFLEENLFNNEGKG